jgi:hypothetical protein
MATALIPRSGEPIEIRIIAREAGLHPDLVRRFVALGLVGPPFTAGTAASLARAARLRHDLGLSYAGAVLASELLSRIDELERRLSRYEPR